jgi:hypothetical protein
MGVVAAKRFRIENFGGATAVWLRYGKLYHTLPEYLLHKDKTQQTIFNLQENQRLAHAFISLADTAISN